MTELTSIAAEVRGRLVEMSHKANAGHLGSALSCVDILVALYWNVLRLDPAKPDDPNRDIFILSKGHAIATQYVCLAMRGFFPVEELETYGKAGSRLPEQPSPCCVPGIECATGSLGHGLGIGIGLALAAKIQKRSTRVFVVFGDGELNEGSIWEAFLFAVANRLGNLIAVVDMNGAQGIGRDSEIMWINHEVCLFDKMKAMNWNSAEIDGHCIERLIRFLEIMPKKRENYPTVIAARTIKGKGVSFLEDKIESHYKTPSSDEVIAAKKELGV